MPFCLSPTGDNSKDQCDESKWPDKDHGTVCGDCKVLVDRFNSFYKTCQKYCQAIGLQCKGAWEEQADDCKVKHEMTCTGSGATVDSSDAICECFPSGAGPWCVLAHLMRSHMPRLGLSLLHASRPFIRQPSGLQLF